MKKIIICALVEKEIEVRKISNSLLATHKEEIRSYLKYVGFDVKAIKHRFEKETATEKKELLIDIKPNEKGLTWKNNSNVQSPRPAKRETSLERNTDRGLFY